MVIADMTGDSERSVRRQIYLTIMSSLDFEECAHKLLKSMGEGHEVSGKFLIQPPRPNHLKGTDYRGEGPD